MESHLQRFTLHKKERQINHFERYAPKSTWLESQIVDFKFFLFIFLYCLKFLSWIYLFHSQCIGIEINTISITKKPFIFNAEKIPFTIFDWIECQNRLMH